MDDFNADSTEDRLLERDIQTYLSKNLHLLGRKLTLVGVEHEVPFGRIDILAVDENFNHTVIEVKRGIATRDAIGQIQSYMGAVRQNFPDSNVQGVLVAREIDRAAAAALLACTNIEFVRFQIQFTFQLQNIPQREPEPKSLWTTLPPAKQASMPFGASLNTNDAWPK